MYLEILECLCSHEYSFMLSHFDGGRADMEDQSTRSYVRLKDTSAHGQARQEPNRQPSQKRSTAPSCFDPLSQKKSSTNCFCFCSLEINKVKIFHVDFLRILDFLQTFQKLYIELKKKEASPCFLYFWQRNTTLM